MTSWSTAAGATGPIETPAWEIESQDFNDLLRKNVTGAFLPIKHVLPAMIEQRYGKIVTIGGASGACAAIAIAPATARPNGRSAA